MLYKLIQFPSLQTKVCLLFKVKVKGKFLQAVRVVPETYCSKSSTNINIIGIKITVILIRNSIFTLLTWDKGANEY